MSQQQVPEALADWTLKAVETLLIENRAEDDRYDFKASIVGRGSSRGRQNHNESIRRTAASFANSAGGFIVFGVAEGDNSTDRLIGLESSREHTRDLVNILKHIEPSIDFFPGTPIELETGKQLLVIEVPASRRGPHWDSATKKFWRRSMGTAVDMSYVEVESAFSDYRERRNRLHVTFISLADNWERLRELANFQEGRNQIPNHPVDPATIRRHLADIQSECPEIMADVIDLLKILDEFNIRLEFAAPLVTGRAAMGPRIADEFIRWGANMAHLIHPRFKHAIEELAQRFDFEPVALRYRSVPPIELF